MIELKQFIFLDGVRIAEVPVEFGGIMGTYLSGDRLVVETQNGITVIVPTKNGPLSQRPD